MVISADDTRKREPAAGVTARKRELTRGILLVTAICAIPVFVRFAPAWATRLSPPCLWKMATGFYCPGCGTFRSLKSLAAFDFSSAFLYNPFLFLAVMPIIFYMATIYLIRGVTGKWVPSLLSSPKSILPAAVITIGAWVFRNVFPLGLQ